LDELGPPPEDESGAGEGTPVSIPSPPSDRVKSLADRVDAMMAQEDDDVPSAGDTALSVPAVVDNGDPKLERIEEIEEIEPLPTPTPIPSPRVTMPMRAAGDDDGRPRPPPVPPRPVVVVPPRPPVSIPTPGSRVPPARPPSMPRHTTPGMAVPVVAIPPVEEKRAPTPPIPLPVVSDPVDAVIGPPPEIDALAEGGVEVSTATPNIVVDQPLEASLETPTAVDRALAELGDTGAEQRAEVMSKQLTATTDPPAAALLAYELGELYERRLADEARGVKAYARALNLDPSLRPNLWAIRRVFYRRGLWPNLAKLIGAEVTYARDDYERADLLLEKARVSQQAGDQEEARSALDEATRIAPQHQGALLELERVVARGGDTRALVEVWERLAETVEHPARKIGYWLDIGRAAGGSDLAKALEAFDRAAALATGPAAERIARERLWVAEEHGTPTDVAAAIDALATLLLASFGPAGPGAEPGVQPAGERPDRATSLRREVVALRRRQAQLARATAPERAWEVLQQALVMTPGESLVLADLTELAEELGRYDDLAELVQSWQAVEGDPGRAMVLSIRRADALLRGGQLDEARALLAGLEASAPGFIVLTSAAERDALGRADPAALARTYLAAAHAALLGTWLGPGQPPAPDPAAAAALYVQAAEILAYDVGGQESVDEARAALGKALEAVRGYPSAIEGLTELDDVTGNVEAALSRLRTQAIALEGDAKRGILERAVRLARSHGDLESVVALEREIVALAPADLRLKWHLEATLSQLARDDERAALLVEIAAAETDASRKGTALLAAARLRERAGAVEPATELYRQVLALWPDDTFARESLIDLLRAQERWTELVTERRNEARLLPDGPAARRALREAAWVLEVRLDDAASAAQVYDEWLARFADDRTALEGAARCRAGFGDRNGEVVARAAIAELDESAEAQWLWGRSLERAGQIDEAADVFRGLAARDAPDARSVASISAALALGDLAAGRADTVMRVEATAALAARTQDSRLAGALAEDSGWMYALVLEDFDRAAQAFQAAIELEPKRRGALLGAALVAARRMEPGELARAYESLAASVAMPEAAAAMHLRAAAMAAANGDLELANQRVALARTAAPDDASALLVVAETQTTPSVDELPRSSDHSAVVDPLLARAEILEMRSALADDPAARSAWELDRAEALELAGRLREAGTVVVAVLRTQPDDLRALEALRRMSLRAGDRLTWARASYALARLIGDPAAKLQMLRESVSVFDDASNDIDRTPEALATYKRILKVDPGAPEIDRLLGLLRERADIRGLIGALTDRLTYLEAAAPRDNDPDAHMVPLLLERATVLHGIGDAQGAMADLDALLARAPKQIEALRFRADLALNAGDVEGAVTLWKRCLQSETRPQRRNEIELALAQVLAENVNDIAGAIENLESVVEANPDDPQLRERLLGLATRASDWDRAARELRVLARLRPTVQEKAREELRLGVMLRDRLGDRTSARLAFDRARALDPLNLDVVRELADLLDPPSRAQVLAATAASFRASIAQSPSRAVLYERLAQVTAWQSDVDARWLALVGLEALSLPSTDQRQVLAQGRHMIAGPAGNPAKQRLAPQARAELRGPLNPALSEMWRAIAPAVQVAIGVDVAKLGFTRGDRIAIKKLGQAYEPLATALMCFGLEAVEIYINAGRQGMARALAGETPILCLGADVAAAQLPHQRYLLGRSVATIAEGLATLPELRDGELDWTIGAALRASDIAIPPVLAEVVAGEDATIAERIKILKKELSRKAKAAIQQLAQKAHELVDVAGFRRAALAVGQRAGTLWAGDLSVALAQLDVGKGGRALSDSPAALELVAWSISDEHLRLRDHLGVALKGIR
jgi:tetratricopeptide (TPR) repeat protein